MAIKLETQYPGRTTVDANNPDGTMKNSSPPGSLNGTPGDFAWAKDMWSFLEILMSKGSVVHNDAPDDATASQRYDALVKLARDFWPIWDPAHEYGQGVVSIGSDGAPYYSLQSANTNHNPISTSGWWQNFSIEVLRELSRNVWPVWDSTNSYIKGAVVIASNKTTYQSQDDDNLGNNPIIPSIWWTAFVPPPSATKSIRGLSYLGDQKITTSLNAIDPVNDIDFTGGKFIFDDGSGEAIASVYTKQLDTIFAEGTNQGMLDTGTIGDNVYHLFAIFNPTSSNRDYLASLSPTTPALPGGYTKKRYLWSIIRIFSIILPYTQYDRYCQLKIPLTDNATGIGGTATLISLTVPTGKRVLALLNVEFAITSGLPGTDYLRLFATDDADVTPDQYNAQLTSVEAASPHTGSRGKSSFEVLTDTNGQIYGRSTIAAVSNIASIGLRGWINLE